VNYPRAIAPLIGLISKFFIKQLFYTQPRFSMVFFTRFIAITYAASRM
jgi:hypothetical protein